MAEVEEVKAENQQDQKSDPSKEKKKFDDNILKLVAILGPEAVKGKRTRVKRDAMGEIIEQLLAEKKETAIKKLKTDLNALLEKKVNSDRAIEEEKKKLQKFETEQYKGFNKEAEGVFSQIEDLDNLTKEYHKALGQAGGAEPPVTSSDEGSMASPVK